MKHKLLNIFILLSCVSCLPSCSDDIVQEMAKEDNVKTSSESTIGHKLSLANALKRSEPYIKGITPNMNVRSERRITNVEYVTRGMRTRGGSNNDTLFYIVNYGNNERFAMLGADERLLPVYAASDSGSLSMSDTTENKGLKMFFNSTLASIDSIPAGWKFGDLIYNDPRYSDESTLPLLSEYQQKIHQSDPFNQYCPLVSQNGTILKRCVVGCAAIAMEQILSYYQYPSRVCGYLILWEKANKGERDYDIAKVLVNIGTQLLNMKYGEYLSSAEPERFPNAFQALDYSTPVIKNFDTEIAANELKSMNPILVYGYNDYPFSGHAWVIDGYKKYGWLHPINGSAGGPTYYFHCIWGDRGINNGYFYFETTGSVNYNNNTVYKNIMMLTGVRPLYNYI